MGERLNHRCPLEWVRHPLKDSNNHNIQDIELAYSEMRKVGLFSSKYSGYNLVPGVKVSLLTETAKFLSVSFTVKRENGIEQTNTANTT